MALFPEKHNFNKRSCFDIARNMSGKIISFSVSGFHRALL